MPELPEVQRLWTVAVIAERFHVLPSVVAKDLDEDPEQLSLQVLPLLDYGKAKNAFDTAKDESELKNWKDSSIMDAVNRNTFDLHRIRVERERAKRGNSNG